MRGKQWSVEEERQLRELVKEGKSLEEISQNMGKSVLSVKGKLHNLGLNKLRVGRSFWGTGATTTVATTTSSEASASVNGAVFGGIALKLKQKLSTLEENAKRLDAANALLTDPNVNLSRTDVQRLHAAVLGTKTYHEVYVKYVQYRKLEEEVAELKRKLAEEKDQ